jgi:hypothetical protein
MRPDLEALRNKIAMMGSLIHEDACESKDEHTSRCKEADEVLGLFDDLVANLPARGAEGPAPGVDLAIVTQEKGWHGMPVRVLVSNGAAQEWYYCHGHPMAQVAPAAPAPLDLDFLTQVLGWMVVADSFICQAQPEWAKVGKKIADRLSKDIRTAKASQGSDTPKASPEGGSNPSNSEVTP